MKNTLLSEEYALSKRVQLVQSDSNTISIVKKRKSRIIMKDGVQILAIAESIWTKNKSLAINLIISGPICSKTRKFLAEHSIEIISE